MMRRKRRQAPAEAGADGELSLGVEPETTLSDSTGIWETSVLTSLLKAISNIPLSPTNISPASIAAAARMSRACFIKKISFLSESEQKQEIYGDLWAGHRPNGRKR